MIRERRELARAVRNRREAELYRQIRSAFVEGFRYGTKWRDPEEAWRGSMTQRLIFPRIRAPGDGIRRMLHEWRFRTDSDYAERWIRHCDRLYQAFIQGHHAGAINAWSGPAIREAWLYSPIRGSLYPGPPTPPHLAALMVSRGGAIDPERRPSLSGKG